MTVASEITKLQTNLTNSYSACEEKGATLPEKQNFDNLPATIGSITGGGGDPSEYKKYGITTNDLWYSFPGSNSTLDETAPHCDMSSSSGTISAYTFANMFKSARVKSVTTPNNTGSTFGTYNYYNMCYNNKCVQYVRIIRTGNSASNYGLHAPCNGATNVKVFVIDFKSANTTITGTYNNSLFGGESKATYKIKSARLDVTSVSANYGLQNIGGLNTTLQTLWLPNLETIAPSGSASYCFQSALSNCENVIGFFAPRLLQIGSSSGSSSKQMSSFISNTSTKFPYLYLPALHSIYNNSTTTSNGTFYFSNGIKKIYLPSITVFGGSGAKNIFRSCDYLTEMHFGKENQAVIEADPNYATLWGLGAGKATVYFDLINKIVVNGKTYKRTQYNDYMTQFTFNDTVYYRDDSLRDSHNIDWRFWSWKSDSGDIKYTQNPLCLVTECVWEYISGEDWDYNQLGDITANDWRYAWTNIDDETDIVYTTNQFTPAVGDTTYTVSADGKSFNTNSTITEVI